MSLDIKIKNKRECPLCEIKLDRSNYSRHCKTKHKISGQIYQEFACKILDCKYRDESKNNVLTHLKDVHVKKNEKIPNIAFEKVFVQYLKNDANSEIDFVNQEQLDEAMRCNFTKCRVKFLTEAAKNSHYNLFHTENSNTENKKKFNGNVKEITPMNKLEKQSEPSRTFSLECQDALCKFTVQSIKEFHDHVYEHSQTVTAHLTVLSSPFPNGISTLKIDSPASYTIKCQGRDCEFDAYSLEDFTEHLKEHNETPQALFEFNQTEAQTKKILKRSSAIDPIRKRQKTETEGYN